MMEMESNDAGNLSSKCLSMYEVEGKKLSAVSAIASPYSIT